MKIFYKNRAKVKTLRTIYPKNQENLKNSKTRAHFTGSYIKECTSTEIRKPLLCNQGSTLSFWWRYLFFQSESPFVYQVINKTKLSITNFQKQIPWNTNESRSLDKTICTYNTSWIFFVFFNYLFIHYSFCTVCINNLKVWGFLTQLCHNERNFLGNMKFKQSPNFVSEFTVWNFRYRFLVYHEIETFTKEVHLKFEDDIIFRFLYIILTIGLWYVSTISHNLQTAWKEAARRINIAERIS